MTRTDPNTIETHVAVPPAAAWRLFTDPHAITQWNQASPDWHCPSAEVDLHVGGRHVARMEARDGSLGFDYSGTYEQVDGPHALTLRLDDDRRVRTTFEPESGGTRVRTVFDPEASNPVEMQRMTLSAIVEL